ncbi:UvrD-helicase domain-containing protein [Ornithinimicrobium sp. INDO-MA30-4]|uniref:UvrD-helicase domain-containing protein n=1 Tax=Ornithinimicrobium sp. INDO-MA30-4 TaxID=2908651 RepID=UPI001F300821|nr:UvrD-helicase domain-containing protein [Ornithinimicrobium sp. INDO-MA30-4]UJH71540.1 UvrD-helicase domain-containing protein [Ornithinimicrobium sp. INDO-MA30-4]
MSLETSTTVPPTVTWSALDIAKALGSPPPTPEQQAIIEGPLESTLVVAGAGSGKTETMASRVLWLVANGLVRPDQILGLTFTRKAALELATRLTSKLRALDGVIDHEDLDIVGVAPVVSTYHAYAGRLVSEHGLRKGIEPGSRLLSEAASWQLAHEVVHSYTGEMSQVTGADSTIVEAVLRLSGEMAEHLQDAESIMEWLSSAADQLAAVPPGKTDKSLGQKRAPR